MAFIIIVGVVSYLSLIRIVSILNSEPYRIRQFQGLLDALVTILQPCCEDEMRLKSIQRFQSKKSIKYEHTLFAGLDDKRLGEFPGKEFHITLTKDAKPYHIKQPYSIFVPLAKRASLCLEVDKTSRMEIVDALEKDFQERTIR